ncbi:MAG: hypothetical protein E6Q33_02725 [Neisseriales bacterium]|mgnify:CR=1 FL=1|nr:MAG: hypothetical protein E6Q33_02725 [Neisseriales bacterium]
MAVVNTKSTSVTNADATPLVRVNAIVNGGHLKNAVETVAVASGDDDGSVYRVLRLHSSCRISRIEVLNSAITNGTDYDIGLYQTAENGGTEADKDVFADGISMATARTTGSYNAAFATLGIANIKKTLWEVLGLSEDPNRYYDLCVTANTVGSADGTVSLSVDYATNS